MRIDIDTELEKINKTIQSIQGCAEKDIFVPRTLYTIDKKEVEGIFDLLENYRLLLENCRPIKQSCSMTGQNRKK